MVWVTNQEIGKWRGKRILIGSLLSWLIFIFITPNHPLSILDHQHHVFADKRNLLGVPNTLNVITNFLFLIVGVVGFVLSIRGGFFNISLKGEIWGWMLFYAGFAGLAFGSAYYHLKPGPSRLISDTLPILIAYSSVFSSFLAERVGERVGLSCLASLLFAAFISVAYATMFNDLRICMTFQLIPCLAIPLMELLWPPKYTHSKYWLLATGAYIVAKIQTLLDDKIYRVSGYTISGHSLGHLCLAAAPILLSIMLLCRTLRFHRVEDLKGHP